MPKPDKRRNAHPKPLAPEVVHDLRNCLGVAVGTADLLLLDGISDQSQARDIEKIREACLRAISVPDRWDSPVTPTLGLIVAWALAA